MTNRQLLKRIKTGIDDLQERYYSNAGDAFCHLALRALFDLDEDDAFEACDVGGANDKDLDAFWHDEQGRRVIAVQARYSASGTKRFDRKVVKDLGSAYGWLKRLTNGKPSEARPQLRAAAEQLGDLRRADPDYPVELYCICLGTFTTSAQEELDAFNAERGGEGAVMELVGIKELREAVSEQQSRDAAPLDGEIKLTLVQHFPFKPAPDQPRTLVGCVDGAELAAIEAKHKYRIFQRNVRYYLKATQKINKSINRTIRSPETRPSFWYYNNGIAIVCDKFTVKKKDGAAVVSLRNMQIVNGCQTTTTLGANLDGLSSGPQAFVLVRIVESDDEALQRDITLYNNRQNAVRDRDLLSNDYQQDRLHDEFRSLDPPWFYERKRGEWDAKVKPSAALRARYAKHRIDNEKAAQAAYAFHFDPAEARARKRLLFVPAQDGGFYDKLFNDDTTPEWLLVPYLIGEAVAERKRAYLKQLRGIKDRQKASAQEKRLLSYEWQKFADQMMIGAFAFYLRQRLELEQDDLEELASADLAPIIDAAYALARRDLHIFFSNRQREAAKREEPFAAANFVKGHWAEVLESLEAEWELREAQGEDPFEDISLLAE